MKIIGGKWRIPVLCTLFGHDTLRYSDIRRKIDGIPNIMLTQILKEFDASGIVKRVQFNEVPPHVEYALTSRGRALMDALHMIADWNVETRDDGFLSNECRICYEFGSDLLPEEPEN